MFYERISKNLYVITGSEALWFVDIKSAIMHRRRRPEQDRLPRHAARLYGLRRALCLLLRPGAPHAGRSGCRRLGAPERRLRRRRLRQHVDGLHERTTEPPDAPRPLRRGGAGPLRVARRHGVGAGPVGRRLALHPKGTMITNRV